VREITADEYRLGKGGDFDEVRLPVVANNATESVEVYDVDIALGRFGMVTLDTARGPVRVARHRVLIVK
jgi:hypothetical protein